MARMERDGILSLVESISTRVCSLRNIARLSREIGIGDPERTGGLLKWSEEVVSYLRAVLLDLSRDPSYNRLILRRKDRAVRYGRKLAELLRQLDLLEEKVVRRTREDLRERIAELAGRKAAEFIRRLRKPDATELVDLLEEVTRELRSGAAPAGRRVNDGGPASRSLSGIRHHLVDLREELRSRGVRFLQLESIHHSLEALPEGVMAEGRRQLLTLSTKTLLYGRILLKLSDDYIRLRGDMEELRTTLARLLRDAGLDELSDLVELIGMPVLELPLTVMEGADIQFMASEVERMRSLVDGLSEAVREAEASVGGVTIGMESGSERGREFPSYLPSPCTMEETLLVRSITNFLRTRRLRPSAGEDYIAPGILDELADLYSVWRLRTLNLLRKRGRIRLDEVGHVPSRWRRWFLDNLEREGVIKVKGDVVSLIEPSSPLSRRVKLKLEFLESMLEGMGEIPGEDGADTDIPAIREEFERIRRRWNEGVDEEELHELEARLGELIRRLGYGRPFVKS